MTGTKHSIHGTTPLPRRTNLRDCGWVCLETQAREAARLLCALIGRLHVDRLTERDALISGRLPLDLFDRLCVWGTACDDCEWEPPDADEDAEDDRVV